MTLDACRGIDLGGSLDAALAQMREAGERLGPPTSEALADAMPCALEPWVELVARRQAAGAVPTLIFDEIDAGVGGTVGDGVGRMLRQLGTATQVLAVTHLPQVAACADHHLQVAKRSDDGGTTSDVHPVREETRVAEIARMLGGEHAGDTRRAHAQALLEGAR